MEYEILHLTDDHPRRGELVAQLCEPELAAQWMADAESSFTPGAAYFVAVADGQAAAWVGYQVEDHHGLNILRVCDQYERRGYRREDTGVWLYPELLAVLHHMIVDRWQGPAYTYVYAVPRQQLDEYGWIVDPVGHAHGTSRLGPDAEEHEWWRMVRYPAQRGSDPTGRG